MRADLTNKNRVVANAGHILTTQPSNPNPSGSYGTWQNGTTEFVQLPDGTRAVRSLNRGTIPASRLAFSVNPTANDTIVIGGTTFKFVAALGVAVVQVQVKIGGSAAATLANLIAAINGDTTNTNWVEATTPFAAAVVADAVTATVLRLRRAPARGGAATAGVSPSAALTASVTGGASAWSVANLNAIGKSEADAYEASGAVTITGAMITATAIQIELPFTPTVFIVQVRSSAGVLRSTTDVMTISGNALNVALAGGASPAIQANDVVTYWARA